MFSRLVEMIGKQTNEILLENNNNVNNDDDDDKNTALFLNNAPGSSLNAAVSNSSESPVFLTTALSHVKDALEMIPEENKKGYLEALRLAPALIKAESDPIKFLRVEDYNPWKSAKRLVLYWEYRKSLFGTSRWLLPMNDSGAGALDQDDIALLQSGWCAFVIPSDVKRGRFFLVDQAKDAGYSMECHLRVAFYLLSVASDIPAQTTGFTTIRLIPEKSPSMAVPRFYVAKRSFSMVKEALPIRLRAVFLLDLQTNDMGRLATFCMNRVSYMLGGLLDTQMPFRVAISAASTAAQELRSMGVPPDVLPVNHGGSWTYDRLFEWKQVVVLDDQNDVGRLVKIPWIAESRPSDQDNTKQVNALYARRAYHKRKLKATEDEQTAKRLKAENVQLEQDNARLESLLERAVDVVALLGDDIPDFEVGDDQQVYSSFSAQGTSFPDSVGGGYPSVS